MMHDALISGALLKAPTTRAELKWNMLHMGPLGGIGMAAQGLSNKGTATQRTGPGPVIIGPGPGSRISAKGPKAQNDLNLDCLKKTNFSEGVLQNY